MTSMDTLLAYLLAFDITFSQSWDNHYKRKFTYYEQHWVLTANKLAYESIQHNKLYTDTIVLNETQLAELQDFFVQNNLYQDIQLHKFNPIAEKMHENRHQIKAEVRQGDHTYKYDLRGVYGTLDNENHYKNLLTLRDFLYKLIEH
jgi:hypothetical protein